MPLDLAAIEKAYYLINLCYQSDFHHNRESCLLLTNSGFSRVRYKVLSIHSVKFLQLIFSKYSYSKHSVVHNKLIVLSSFQSDSENDPEKERRKAYILKCDLYIHVASMVSQIS